MYNASPGETKNKKDKKMKISFSRFLKAVVVFAGMIGAGPITAREIYFRDELPFSPFMIINEMYQLGLVLCNFELSANLRRFAENMLLTINVTYNYVELSNSRLNQLTGV